MKRIDSPRLNVKKKIRRLTLVGFGFPWALALASEQDWTNPAWEYVGQTKDMVVLIRPETHVRLPDQTHQIQLQSLFPSSSQNMPQMTSHDQNSWKGVRKEWLVEFLEQKGEAISVQATVRWSECVAGEGVVTLQTSEEIVTEAFDLSQPHPVMASLVAQALCKGGGTQESR